MNVSQLPFWALSIFLTWRCLKRDKITDYIFLGIVFGLGILSKYLFIYLIFGVKCLFIFKLFYKKKFKNFNFLIVAPITLIIITPHLMWLFENNFLTLTYGLQRASGSENISDHFILPITFIFKQQYLNSFFYNGFFSY